MSVLQPYPEYRDSRLQWLGEVPVHWEAAPVKFSLSRNDGGVWGDDPVSDDDPIVLRSTEQNVDGEWKIDSPARRRLTASDFAKGLLLEGDLLVTKSSGSELHIGKSSIVTREVAELRPCFSNFMQRLRVADKLLPQYLHYVLNNRVAREQFSYLSNSTTGLANLNGGIIGQLLIAIPNFAEQKSIVTFLDRETARIDSLIAEKQNFINLVKEKRQALISHVVTKGLDPKAKVKDSGIEWIGEVPEHWEVVSHRRVITKIEQGWSPQADASPPNETQWGVTKLSAVKGGKFFPAECKAMLEEHDPLEGLQVKEGDFLLTRANTPDLVGDVCVVSGLSDQKIILCDLIYRVSYLPSVNKKYMVYWLLSSPGRSQIKADARGSSMTMAKISQAHIKEWKVPVPPHVEQDVVVALLDSKLKQFDTIVTEVENSIELLKEHRTALISAAVTGKIDVRDC